MENASFSDGKRVDYVLVYSKVDLERESIKMDILKNFIKNIQSEGLKVEHSDGQVSTQLLNIKNSKLQF